MIQAVWFTTSTGGRKVADGPVIAQSKGVPEVCFCFENKPKLLVWRCGPDLRGSFLTSKSNATVEAGLSGADGVY